MTNPVGINWISNCSVMAVSAGDGIKTQSYNPSTRKYDSCVPLRQQGAAARILAAGWGPCGDDGLERSGS
jgi:hypothetical protein